MHRQDPPAPLVFLDDQIPLRVFQIYVDEGYSDFCMDDEFALVLNCLDNQVPVKVSLVFVQMRVTLSYG